ncbi:MAG: hypothetical protein ABI573_11860 [Chloroflexota bacterium]
MKLPSVLIAVLLIASCGSGPASSVPSSHPPGATATAGGTPTSTSSARHAGWASDLDLILPGLDRLHPDPYHSTSKDAMSAALADLAGSIDGATDDALMAGVLRIVALVSASGRDSHTGAYVWGYGTFPTRTLPLRLWVFPEGVVVVDALPPYEGLIGRTVASVDGHPIADVLARLDPFMPRDNPETLTLLAPRFLLTTEILHGAGLIADPSAVPIEFADSPPTGPVVVTAVDTVDYNTWATPYGLFLPTRADVPYLARSTEPIWWRVDNGTTLYVQYNRVTRLSATTLGPLKTALATPGITRLIVDIRHNYGGESFGYQTVVDAMVAGAAGRTGGTFLITGRNTYSAASLFAAALTNRTAVTVVGEAMGGSPALFGNTRDVSLPFSGIVLNVATEFFQPVPGDERLGIAPDRAVPLHLADFLAGRDPALSAIEGRP